MIGGCQVQCCVKFVNLSCESAVSKLTLADYLISSEKISYD
jgi:hypothetical protein